MIFFLSFEFYDLKKTNKNILRKTYILYLLFVKILFEKKSDFI